jgi:nicotinate-nucleotide adenylyltransferase
VVRRACVHCYALSMTRTGLLGGSFNPAHSGHRRISLHAMAALGLDEVWWLVSPGNPLKERQDMASLPCRFASAREMAEGTRIRVTAIERELGTRYTADTLQALRRRFPARRFVWLMGEDNLSQFHMWRRWREIAELVPIAVVSRPGYHGSARAARAMGWLRRFVRPAVEASRWTDWRPPALVLLKLPPDPSSATGIRAADPDWHQTILKSLNPKALRDGVTRRPLI